MPIKMLRLYFTNAAFLYRKLCILHFLAFTLLVSAKLLFRWLLDVKIFERFLFGIYAVGQV